MAKTKRVQVLMDESEFQRIEELAIERHSSVSALMREAARTHLLDADQGARRAEAARAFLDLPSVRLPSWRSLKRELRDRRGQSE